MNKVIEIAKWKKPKQKPLPPVYVKLRADVFREMVETLTQYGLGLADGGAKAQEVMDKIFKENT